MVRSREFFNHFDSSKKGFVLLADDENRAEIKGIGSGAIKCFTGTGDPSKLVINDVLFVP